MACVGYEPIEKLGNIHAGPGNEASWMSVHHTHNLLLLEIQVRQWFVTNYSSPGADPGYIKRGFLICARSAREF